MTTTVRYEDRDGDTVHFTFDETDEAVVTVKAVDFSTPLAVLLTDVDLRDLRERITEHLGDAVEAEPEPAHDSGTLTVKVDLDPSSLDGVTEAVREAVRRAFA